MVQRLIIVSNRLPVSVQDERGKLSLSRSSGGLATALSSLFDENSSTWVGWNGMRRHLSQKELASLDIPPFICPINLTAPEITAYYDTFANGILWPLAHGIAPTATHSTTAKKDVHKVMRLFANAIESIVTPDDIIWIHDYHLFLLPHELRRRGIHNKIGFFLHTPFFPESTLQKVPLLDEILTSLMDTDVIGLQVQRDVHRFHTALKARDIALPPHVSVQAFPIGIDFDSFDKQNTAPDVQEHVRDIKKRFERYKIVFSLSRLDYTKGIITQLEAFERFLSRHPGRKIVYRLNVAPSREAVLEYEELKKDIVKKVTAINLRFATKTWQPVVYTYENIGLHEICAWYQVADVHLNIPIADGMNLVAKEYIAARRQPGSLIISNTMGAATQLKASMIIPPNDPQAAADAIEQAFAMSQEEKKQRWTTLRHEVKEHQASEWAQNFLSSLDKSF
ncbi:MAG TPA: trehalose-6-phosphate synthase [Candidatus Chromulinivoraceae bacterium]|nr:trehalose-6-phosphate synthase [Candidatus Chromulinivoraceae bacterium]